MGLHRISMPQVDLLVKINWDSCPSHSGSTKFLRQRAHWHRYFVIILYAKQIIEWRRHENLHVFIIYISALFLTEVIGMGTVHKGGFIFRKSLNK